MSRPPASTDAPRVSARDDEERDRVARTDSAHRPTPARKDVEDANPSSWIDQWIMPYIHEPTLWPVLVVVIGHVVAGVAPLILTAFRERQVGAAGLLVTLACLSAATVRYELRVRHRPAALSIVVGVSWVLSCGAALLAHRYGIY